MEPVTIYSKEDLSSLWNIVKDRFPNQTVWMQKNKDGDYTLSIKKQYLGEFSKVFSLWIHRKCYQNEVKRILAEYPFLSLDEQEKIFYSVKEELREQQPSILLLLQNKIATMLEISSNLKMGGFSLFCMQEYCEKLEEITNLSLDHYLSEQDYLEFLELLQYFIEIEEYRFGHLIVVAQPNGGYRYYDEELQNITRQCMERFMLEFEDECADPDDCLITILILLLPERVSVYGAEMITNQKFLNTLQSIFEERLQFYHGTDILANKKL